jgi:hypothetical protein
MKMYEEYIVNIYGELKPLVFVSLDHVYEYLQDEKRPFSIIKKLVNESVIGMYNVGEEVIPVKDKINVMLEEEITIRKVTNYGCCEIN